MPIDPSVNPLDKTLREFSPDQKVFGRFRLIRILGRGGMGIVWLAHDDELDRDVALKFLPEIVVHDRAIVADLKRETKRALELTHENIVRIHDFVQDSISACISMEYIDGDTLSSLRSDKATRIFEPDELKPWLTQLCNALDYAHNRARIIHRDLKPSNLMISKRGQLKIADFGIARSLTESVSMLTHSPGTSGTLVYMSPQQLDGERGTHLDDIYSVGATLYELLTSKPPFYSGDISRQIHERIPPSIAQRRRDLDIEGSPVPKNWEEAVATCLAKDPAKRPQTITDLGRQILSVRTDETVPASTSTQIKPKSAPLVGAIAIAIIATVGILLFQRYEQRRDAQKEIAESDRKLVNTQPASPGPTAPTPSQTAPPAYQIHAPLPAASPIIETPPPIRSAPAEPWLGIRVQSLNANPTYQKTFKGIDQGVVVQMVEPASRAAESDLWNADVITHFNGTPVSSEGDVEREVFETKPGDKIQLTVLRNKRVMKIPVRVSDRSRLFAGKWEGTEHQIKFGDQSGNNAYGPDTSPVEIEISDDESHVTTRNPNLPAMPQQNLPNSVPDWWYHQDPRTLAWATDPQYQIELLGDGKTALLKRTPYKDQIDSVPKGLLTTSRALLHKKVDSGDGGKFNLVDTKTAGAPKADTALSSNQTFPGELVFLRIALHGAAHFTLPESIIVDGLEIAPCGIASPQSDPGLDKTSGTVYEYAILPLRAGRFTIPSQSVLTPEQTFHTAILELSVRSGRPELPTFKEWLNRDGLGNLLPPRKVAHNAPKNEAAIEPMIYRRSGRQKLARATVSAYGFSVIIPLDVFPNAVESLRQSNILMPPNTASPSVTYLPPRPASKFDATYANLAAGASPSDPMKVVHYRTRTNNSFIVQLAEADHGEYIAGFKKGNSTYMMDVWYDEHNCPFTADSLKAMTDSFLANGPR